MKIDEHVISIEEFDRVPERGRFRLVNTGKGTMQIVKVETHR